jgi:hypothetical protein
MFIVMYTHRLRCINRTCKKYWKRNTSDARKGVPCCRIPVFEISSQDDVKEFDAYNLEADGSSGFCNKQYSC